MHKAYMDEVFVLRRFDAHHKKFTETPDSSPKVCNWTEILLLQDCQDLEHAGSLAKIKLNITRIQTKIKEFFTKRLHG